MLSLIHWYRSSFSSPLLFQFFTFSEILELQQINCPEAKAYFGKTGQFIQEQSPWDYMNSDFEMALMEHQKTLSEGAKESFLKLMKEGQIQIRPVPVRHCAESSGVVLQLNNKKIVYSGDCTFSETLIEPGKDADLLIHECTFDCSTE